MYKRIIILQIFMPYFFLRLPKKIILKNILYLIII